MLWLLSHLDLSKANLHRWKLGKAQVLLSVAGDLRGGAQSVNLQSLLPQ